LGSEIGSRHGQVMAKPTMFLSSSRARASARSRVIPRRKSMARTFPLSARDKFKLGETKSSVF
jgi:hypothetical protein